MRDLVASLESAQRQNAAGALKTVEDLARYQILLDRIQPKVIVETGTLSGRSAIWFADHSAAQVLTVDLDEPPRVCKAALAHPNVRCLRGSSVEMAPTCAAIIDGRAPVLVILDSDHSGPYVLTEMEAYAPLVTPGSYMVVEDTIVRWLTGPLNIYQGSPLDAVESFLATNDGWTIDMDLEDLYPTTLFPSGWLRRDETATRR